MNQGRSKGRMTKRRARRRTRLVCALALLCSAVTVHGESDAPPPDALRVRGIVDRDTLWSGHVLITDDTNVLGATLTIAAGTVIEFAAAPSKTTGPTLTIGSEAALPGWLTVTSTHDRPIVIRTREGRPNGAMVIHARTLERRRRAPGEETEGAGLNLTNVTFEGLGDANRPSVEILLRDPSGLVVFDRCLLSRCGRLRVVQIAEASVDLSRNRITAPTGATALELVSGASQAAPNAAGNATKDRPAAQLVPELRVRENHLAGQLRLAGVAAEVQSNLLIGGDAAVVIEGRAGGTCVVRENFVHQASRRSSRGSASLDCADPSVHVVGNLLWSGDEVVSRGSQNMSQNVLIAPADSPREDGRTAPARAVVAYLPDGARFEENLLIGPASTLLGVGGRGASLAGLAPSEASSPDAPSVIRRNTFDGGRIGSRGIALASSAPCEVSENLFLETRPAVVDETLGAARVRLLDYNARGEPADRAYRKVRPADGTPHGEHDVTLADATGRNRRELDATLREIESDLLAEKLDVPGALRRLRALYAPSAGSPLVGGGRADERGVSATIGAVQP